MRGARFGLDARSQRDERRMEAELVDGKHAAAGFLLDLPERVEIPRVENRRFFTDGVRLIPQREADVRVVEIVRRTDADVFDLITPPAQLVHVPVESFELGEEIGGRKIAVDNADAVI